MTLAERIAAGERLTAEELAEWNNRGLTRRPTWCDDAGVIRSEGAVTWWFPPEEPEAQPAAVVGASSTNGTKPGQE